MCYLNVPQRHRANETCLESKIICTLIRFIVHSASLNTCESIDTYVSQSLTSSFSNRHLGARQCRTTRTTESTTTTTTTTRNRP